tara:strand:- start:2532 stop:2822 length:291 start_codon:yes stop_codon:yes gene_type:complete
MPEPAAHDVHDWPRDWQKLGVLTWISFLTAAAFSVLLFAFLDPLDIVDAINCPYMDSRNAGYAIGFVFLWLQGWIGGWLILRLVRRKRNWPHRIEH